MSPILLSEQRLSVGTGADGYPILFGRGLLRDLPRRFCESKTAAIITNSTVASLYAPLLVDGLGELGIEPIIVEIPEGEQFKTLDTVSTIYDRLLDARIARDTVLFALGGGVIGDIAGFVAATLLRGLDLVQVPTSLLAMVDASIGGKSAVDHARGKNLIGAFNQPRAVIADLETLKSLPAVEKCSGMAEVIKSAVIGDPTLFQELESENSREQVDLWICQAMQVKVDLVTRDPFERNERAKLNLGHTFAHALERVTNFRLRHGEAVGIGLVCAARLAVNHGMCESKLAERIEGLVADVGLPTRIPRGLNARELFRAMQTDKKRMLGQLRYVLPRALGDVVIVDNIPESLVLLVLQPT